jgi:diguanylate cyclase (GGDEF)-like protein
LANYRHFREEAQKEHLRCTRYKAPYALVFIDADHFKNYNDQNGHPAGDRLLKELSRILKEEVRETDLPARYGGEEFVILCPGVDAPGAAVLAERVRVRVEKNQFEHGEKQPLGKVTVSIGVAGFPEHGATMDEVLQAADQALYRSKSAGRNRCTVMPSAGAKTETPDRRKKAA